jgi:hypothetical protein
MRDIGGSLFYEATELQFVQKKIIDFFETTLPYP